MPARLAARLASAKATIHSSVTHSRGGRAGLSPPGVAIADMARKFRENAGQTSVRLRLRQHARRNPGIFANSGGNELVFTVSGAYMPLIPDNRTTCCFLVRKSRPS